MAVLYERVALIGLGLIASSMAHAMKANGLAGEIVGYARSAETRAAALEIGRRPGMEGKRIVAIIPSFAERYLSTALFEGL